MTDSEAQRDETRVKVAMTREREYTEGWRAYVNGRPRPTTTWASIGWLDACAVEQVAGRDVRWSAGESVPADWRRAETDRDTGTEATCGK